MDIIETVFVRNNLVVAFAVVGVTIWISYFFADRLTGGRIHGSATAIALGLLAAWTAVAVHHLVDKLYVNNIYIHLGVMFGLLQLLEWQKPMSRTKEVLKPADKIL